MTRKDWFERFFLPQFKSELPKEHITFAIFGNKSRNEEGFDKRRKKENFLKLAQAIRDEEVKSHKAAEEGSNEDAVKHAKLCVDRFKDYLNEPTAQGLNKRRAIRKLELSKIQDVIPHFSSLRFKIYGCKVDKSDSDHASKFKKALAKAYQELYYDNNADPLIEWMVQVDQHNAKIKSKSSKVAVRETS
jgi:N-methylhydantoinase A/oxoprolinase/acetone carboxylase beta subunit